MALLEGNIGGMSTASVIGVHAQVTSAGNISSGRGRVVRMRLLSVPVCARPAVWALLARLSRLS